MPEIDPEIVWYYILKTNGCEIKLGEDKWFYLVAENIDPKNHEGEAIARQINELDLNKSERFVLGGRDFNYDPPRESVESCVRKRIEKLGWFDEFELAYLLSPPDEKYVGPGSKEYEEEEKRIEQEKRDGTYVEIVF